MSPTLILALAILAGPGADPAAPLPIPSVMAGAILWRGMPDGAHRNIHQVLDLAPDGRSFLYLQGDPWPRVMLQRLPAGAGGSLPEPEILCALEPWGGRAPRFDLEGRAVFFTADLTPRGADASRPTSRPGPVPARVAPGESLHAAVMRVRPGTKAVERIWPLAGSPSDRASILMDVHPGGRTLLVGTGSGLDPREAFLGNLSLELEELSFPDGGTAAVAPAPLGFQVSSQALVRYSWDGTAVIYSLGPVDRGPVRVLRYDRASGTHEPTGGTQEDAGRLAGDLETHSILLAHPGGFGSDGFPLQLLSRSLDGPAVVFSSEGLPGSLPFVPVSFRENRALLASGIEDRRMLLVTSWDPAAFEGKIAAVTLSGPPGPWGLSAALQGSVALAEVRAAALDPKALTVLRALHAGRALSGGRTLRSARARWVQRIGGAGSQERRLESIELASGALRIEKVTPAGKAGDPEEREVIAFDGKEAWAIAARGDTMPLDWRALLVEGCTGSPFRLLLDPAGLGLPWIAFRWIGEETETVEGGGTRPLARLEIRSLDGYSALLLASLEGYRARVHRIESDLLLPQEKGRQDQAPGREKKSISFDGYKELGGCLVPGRIRFDDGSTALEMELEDLELDPPGAEEAVRRKPAAAAAPAPAHPSAPQPR